VGLRNQDFNYQQSRANHDGAVRQIENWPLIALEVEQQKVDDAPAGQAVPEIPQSPSHNQRQANACDHVSVVVFPEQNRDYRQRDHGKRNQQARFPGRGRVCEQAESGASVLSMRKAKKARDDLDVRIKRDALRHDMLGPAVKQDNNEGDQEVKGACGVLGHVESVQKHLNPLGANIAR
jgi:hypothetical protein